MTDEIFTVSSLNRRVREVLQHNFPLFWVAGEISNLTRASSGHIYFSLKDANAQVRCVMFRNRAQVLPWQLENGQQVEARALVGLYEPRGDFQLNIEALRRAGLGRLYEAYARLREQLEHEGLFAAQRKRPLPRYPKRIGIITSAQAAALQDILKTLQRRAPHLSIVVYPTAVQGEGVGMQIAAAIQQANQRASQDQIELLIVARGGGSIEDLWGFNEEVVARAIAHSKLPIISGIGHETDSTIADFVADQRASTPTAAAELVSAQWSAIQQALIQCRLILQRQLRSLLDTRAQRLDLLAHRLIHPGKRLLLDQQRLAHLTTRLNATLSRQLKQHSESLNHWRWRLTQSRPTLQAQRQRLALSEQRLNHTLQRRRSFEQQRLKALADSLQQLSPQATLERGYSIVQTAQGQIIRDSHTVKPNELIHLRFAQGSAEAHIATIKTPSDSATAPSPPSVTN